jgi:hypothetical protein
LGFRFWLHAAAIKEGKRLTVKQKTFLVGRTGRRSASLIQFDTASVFAQADSVSVYFLRNKIED